MTTFWIFTLGIPGIIAQFCYRLCLNYLYAHFTYMATKLTITCSKVQKAWFLAYFWPKNRFFAILHSQIIPKLLLIVYKYLRSLTYLAENAPKALFYIVKCGERIRYNIQFNVCFYYYQSNVRLILGLGGIHKERPQMFVPWPFHFSAGVRIN